MNTNIMKQPISILASMRFCDIFGDQSVDDVVDLLKKRRMEAALPVPAEAKASLPGVVLRKGILKEFERAVVLAALAQTSGNISAAARTIGVERKAFERRMARYKIKK